MANLITLSRLILLMTVVVIAYTLPPVWNLLNVVLLILTFATDGFDGHIARKRNETSQFGAMFDIAADRIVEWTLWIVFVDLGLVPTWVLLVFVIRGVIVDAIRATQAAAHRQSPFSMMASRLGRWLVAGKFMRISYAVLKAVAFCWLMLSFPMPEIAPSFWQQWSTVIEAVSMTLILACVGVCIARGAPVIAEFVYAERHSLLGSLTHGSDKEHAS